MNCECFYIIKEGTIEAARIFADRVSKRGNDKQIELWPVCISKVKKSFIANRDYDYSGWPNQPKVKEGDILVFVQGKYHYMGKFKGGSRAFLCPEFQYENHIDDIENLEGEDNDEI